VICANCQAENRPDRKFCLRCGQPLAASCPNCGASNEPEAAFCGECGTRLGAAASGAGLSGAVGSAASGPSASPASGVGAVAPVAERRLVSVLFADLVGYTTIAERLDPDDARELLDRYFAASREIVQRYGGVGEVHRRRGHGRLGRPDEPRGRRGTGRPRGARPRRDGSSTRGARFDGRPPAARGRPER
jgi:hypothetical protein